MSISNPKPDVVARGDRQRKGGTRRKYGPQEGWLIERDIRRMMALVAEKGFVELFVTRNTKGRLTLKDIGEAEERLCFYVARGKATVEEVAEMMRADVEAELRSVGMIYGTSEQRKEKHACY
jgi:hypothetical protein